MPANPISPLLPPQTDEQLVVAMQADDREAFAQLYERYWADLFRVATQKLASAELAEETVQDLFVSLWQRRHSLVIAQVNRYLFSALKFAVIDHIRSRQVHERYLEQYTALANSSTTPPDDSLALQDLTRSIENGLRMLPPKTQQVFRLSRFEHLTIPEIAVRISLSDKVVEYHLGNALRALRNYLRTYNCLLLC